MSKFNLNTHVKGDTFLLVQLVVVGPLIEYFDPELIFLFLYLLKKSSDFQAR